ncbi:hypothetical protein BJ742DRAFT_772687 [Cladochytrium replicatum]|nr:hypothetical protein BJ742DRAFT_772687 [Cladochytrium replicatum]
MVIGGTSRTKSAATIDRDDEGERKDPNFEEAKLEDPRQQLWLFRIPKNHFHPSATNLHVAINPQGPITPAQIIDASADIPEGLESFDLHGISVTALHTSNHDDDEENDPGEVVDMSTMKCVVPSNEKRRLKIGAFPPQNLSQGSSIWYPMFPFPAKTTFIPKHHGTILEKIAETNPISDMSDGGRKGKRKGAEDFVGKAADDASETKTKKSNGGHVKVEAESDAFAQIKARITRDPVRRRDVQHQSDLRLQLPCRAASHSILDGRVPTLKSHATAFPITRDSKRPEDVRQHLSAIAALVTQDPDSSPFTVVILRAGTLYFGDRE